VYYYSCAKTLEEGISEANFLYENCLKNRRFEYPIYIDVEDQYWQARHGKGTTDAIIGFCNRLEQLGFYAGVYASLSWFDNTLQTYRLKRFTKWVASWRGQKPNVSFNAFDLWQNSDNGVINKYIVDTDQAFKDFESIIKSNGLNGYKKLDEIADEVIKGFWGTGSDRKQRLTAEGYDYEAVQKKVNEILLKEK